MSENIKHVTDASFETDVLKSGKPVLVDFWAEWCAPCKMLAPILEEISANYGDRLQIVKIDVDSNQDVPKQFQVRGIPTLMLFKDGQAIGTRVGNAPKSYLSAFINQSLGWDNH